MRLLARSGGRRTRLIAMFIARQLIYNSRLVTQSGSQQATIVMTYHVRHMQLADIDSILLLQARVYDSSLLEDADFYRNRLAISPQNCWVAERQTNLLGYLITYPWTRAMPPELNTSLQALPADADCWFVHDCAVSVEAQGCGVAKALLSKAGLAAREQGLRYASLVSLATATDYWLHQGYCPIDDNTPQLQKKLSGYGDGASYMCKSLVK